MDNSDELRFVVGEHTRLGWDLKLPDVHPLCELAQRCAEHNLYPYSCYPPITTNVNLQYLIGTGMAFDEMQIQWLLYWSCFDAWSYHSAYRIVMGNYCSSPDGLFHWKYTIDRDIFEQWESWHNDYHDIDTDGDSDEDDDD